jgi:hypothetical protein
MRGLLSAVSDLCLCDMILFIHGGPVKSSLGTADILNTIPRLKAPAKGLTETTEIL